MMNIYLIAAMTRDRVLGRGGKLPWNAPEEKQLYRRTIEGSTVIMGRKTFGSYGNKPLAKSPTIVVSRTLASVPGVDVCGTMEEALDKARGYGRDVYIIGGGEVFELGIKVANKMYVSYIEGSYEGDTLFPIIDENIWKAEKIEKHHGFERVLYTRR